MILKKWSVRNYKSIENGQSVDFSQINVLVGENNTGKSSVIDAIYDYIEAFPVGNGIEQEWVQKRITREEGANKLAFGFTFELDNNEREEFFNGLIEADLVSGRVSERWDDDAFRTVRHELVLEPSFDSVGLVEGESNVYSKFRGEEVTLREGGLDEDDADYLDFNKLDNIEMSSRGKGWAELLKIINESLNSYQFVDAFRRPENLRDAVENIELSERGDNLSQVLLTLVADNDNRFGEITDTYAEVMRGIDKVKSPLRGNKTTVEIKEEVFDGTFDLSEISAGSKEILTLITQIVLASDSSDMVLIEEPELHLHPGAQRKIFNLIQEQLADGPQVVLSTHSSVFVDHDRADNIISVKRESKTQLSQPSEDEISADLKELGYRYSGMLQSDAVVIVEGTTDKTILRTMADKYGFNLKENRVGLCDMENSVNLVNHSRSLVKIFSVFSIPYLFICDSDISEHLDDDVDSREELPADAIEGKIRGHINRSDKNGEIWWNEAKAENIHVWREEEIEAYLLADRGGVIDCFDISGDELSEILDESPSLDPDEQLEEVCEVARPHIDSDKDAMDKPTDTADLARSVSLDAIPEEFHDVMEEVAALVDARQEIKKARPN